MYRQKTRSPGDREKEGETSRDHRGTSEAGRSRETIMKIQRKEHFTKWDVSGALNIHRRPLSRTNKGCVLVETPGSFVTVTRAGKGGDGTRHKTRGAGRAGGEETHTLRAERELPGREKRGCSEVANGSCVCLS